jgi:hypothetical protein
MAMLEKTRNIRTLRKRNGPIQARRESSDEIELMNENLSEPVLCLSKPKQVAVLTRH